MPRGEIGLGAAVENQRVVIGEVAQGADNHLRRSGERGICST
jgi:hypothetical protein